VINGNPSIVVTLFVVLALWSIRSGHDPLAGFLLAMATIKPQRVVLFIPLVLLWAISRRRWGIVFSFIGSLALLIATFTLFFPDWILQNLRQILSYPRYTLPSTSGTIFSVWVPGVGKQLGWGLTIVLSILLLSEWLFVLGKDFRWLLWTSSLTLVITNLIGIPTATENYVVMFSALVLVFSIWDERWGKVGRWLVAISMLILFAGLWYLFIGTLQPGDQPIQSPLMFFPLPLFLLGSLYWVRWWAIRPPRVLVDLLREASAREST
jgi:hypothetical protein